MTANILIIIVAVLFGAVLIQKYFLTLSTSANSTLTTDEIKNYVGIYKTPNGVFYINPANLFALGSNGQRIDLTKELPTGVTITSIRGASAIGTAPFSGQLFTYARAGETGNLPRNFINGPMYINWDAGLSKSVHFTESARLQLRWELFNVLNHANYSLTSGNTTIFSLSNTTSFGRVNTNYSPRIMQFGARFDF